ncbi:MAG: MBL fold metallo-hydrolase [Deltaproteobacteria bacterium]|nr:MBL fold metallo-hydrolase [Deltaproteobacteria bacterium]
MRDLFFLTCGRLKSPAAALASKPTLANALATTFMSITVAVVVRENGDLALVDAGFSSPVCADPTGTLGALRALTLGVDLAAQDSIARQLRALGLDPARVKTIVATHLHLDHVGGAADFPNAEVVCSDRELRALFRMPRDAGYRVDDFAREGRLHVVDLGGAPMLGFPRSRDLFADGELVLLDAHGHTPGNVAVAVRGADRTFVHIGDAVYQSWEFSAATPGPSPIARLTAQDREALARTYGAIRACAADGCRPVIVPSHDLEVFRALPHAPRAAATTNAAATGA